MPQFTIASGETDEIIEEGDSTPYHIAVTGDEVTISAVEDQRYAGEGITYNPGYIGPVHNPSDRPVFARASGSGTATIEMDESLANTGTFDPEGINNLDVDIAEQSLSQLTAVLEGDDHDGNTAEVQVEQLGTALGGSETGIIDYATAQSLSSVGNDELRVDIISDSSGDTTDDVQIVDVNFDTTQTNNLAVDLAADSLSGNLDVDIAEASAGTLAVEQQTPVALEDDGGTAISTSNPLSVDLRTDNLSGNLDVDIAEASAEPLDVSAATVTVTDDGSFNVAGTVGVEDSTGTQVDPATDDFASSSFSGQDINASTQTIDFTGGDGTVPARAESVSIIANPTGDGHAEVIFYDDSNKTNTIGTITDTENSDLGSTGGSLIAAEVAVMTPFFDVDFVDDSGAANSTSGSAYCR